MGIIKKSMSELIYGIVFSIFLIFTNYAFYNFTKISFTKDLNIFSFIFLGIAIMQIEVSFKNEETKKCISGIEILLMAVYTLTLPYISQLYNSNFKNILFISGGIIITYYIVKSIIMFAKNKKEFLRFKEDFIKESYDIDSELDDTDEDD